MLSDLIFPFSSSWLPPYFPKLISLLQPSCRLEFSNQFNFFPSVLQPFVDPSPSPPSLSFFQVNIFLPTSSSFSSSAVLSLLSNTSFIESSILIFHYNIIFVCLSSSLLIHSKPILTTKLQQVLLPKLNEFHKTK